MSKKYQYVIEEDKDINKEDDLETIYKNIKDNAQKIHQLRSRINILERKNRDSEIHVNEIIKNQGHNFKLNQQQQNAVNCSKGNNIIVACPGSGKTHTLIAKVVSLVQKHKIDPDNIIMITYTKKAAQEINKRLTEHLQGKNLLHTGTLHGLAYRILQKYHEINYTILDEYDCYRNLKNKVKEEYADKNYSDEIKTLLEKNVINVHEKLSAYYPMSIKDLLIKLKLSPHLSFYKEVFKNYIQFKKNHKYLDFNDLMSSFLEFLKSDESNDFRKSIKYILFDEYQDVNAIQDIILTYMNNIHQNLTVVGDDSQSIYAFRGSDNRYILTFKNCYPDVKVHYLESNYRSTKQIVAFCNNIIIHNAKQLDKKMVAVNKIEGLKPKIVGFNTAHDEMKYIVDKIIYNNKNLGISLKEQVIITRKNRQLDYFELYLIKNKINYVKTKGVGLLDRVHIKDFLAFIIIITNKKSIVHWKRIITILTGVGSVTAQKVLGKKNIYKCVVSNSYSHKIAKLIVPLSKVFNKIDKCTKKKKKDIGKMCGLVIDFLKPIILKNTKLKDKYNYDEKIGDLYALQSHIANTGSFEKFLEDIHLNVDVEDKMKSDANEDYLLLSTIHGSKGLEWEYVYLAGCSSDLIPSYRPNIYTEEVDETEEERRLFYVGCSRAKKSLEVTLSYDYHFVNSGIYASPFINEINKDLYDGLDLRFIDRIYKGNVTTIITNYLLLESSSRVYNYLKSLPYDYKSLYSTNITDNIFFKNRADKLYGTFIDNLIAKMIYQKYNNEIDDFDIPIYQKYNYKKDFNYYRYTDPNSDWRDVLSSVLTVSLKTSMCRCKINYKTMDQFINRDDQVSLYEKIEKSIIDIVNESLEKSKNKPKQLDKKINLHYNLSFGEVLGEADLVVGRTLIEIKTSRDCVATTRNVIQTIFYRYMLRQKGIRIDDIVLFNPLLGEIYRLHVTPNWKETFRVYNEIIE